MDIFKLQKEELINIVNNKQLFETLILKTNGMIVHVCDFHNIDMNLNKLFENNEINLKIFENIYPIMIKQFDTLTQETILTLSSLISLGNHTEKYGDLSYLIDKILLYCDKNNLKITSLNDISLYSGLGDKRTVANKKDIKYINPLEVKTAKIEDIELLDEVEKPYEYERDYYESDREQDDLEEALEKKVNALKSSNLKKPYSFSSNSFNSIHQELYSKELNKDDLDLERLPVNLRDSNKVFFNQLKSDLKNPTVLTLNFLINLNYLDKDNVKTLYSMLSNDEVLALLKNNDLLELAGEKTAEMAIYNEFKQKESLFFEKMTYILYNNIKTSNPVSWKEYLQQIINDKSLIGLLKDEDIVKLEPFLPKDKTEHSKLLELTEEIINIAKDRIEQRYDSKEVNDWKNEFKEYCSLKIRKYLMSAIEVPQLNREDLHFIREQIKLTENRGTEILENNLSKVTIGLSGMILNASAYTEVKTIFNNDKTLLLKDLFLESIDKPYFLVDNLDHSPTYEMLVKYNNPDEKIEGFKTIVNSSFKYLTIEEALEKNYHERVFIPSDNVKNYVLEKEWDKLSNLTASDWRKIFLLQKTKIAISEHNTVFEKIYNFKGVFSPDDLIDTNVAEIILKEVIVKRAYYNSKYINLVLDSLDINQIKEIENPLFYFNNDLVKSIISNIEKLNQKTNRRSVINNEKILHSFSEILSNKSNNTAVDIDFNNCFFDLNDRKSNIVLLSINKLVEHFEKNNEIEKIKIVLKLGNQLYGKLTAYEAEREKIIKDYTAQVLQLDVSLDKYSIKELNDSSSSVSFMMNDHNYKSKFSLEKEPTNKIEENIFIVKNKLRDIVFKKLGVEKTGGVSLNILLNALVSKEHLLDMEEEHINEIIDLNMIERYLGKLLSEFSPEMTYAILENNSMHKFGVSNWEKHSFIKNVFTKQYGEDISNVKIYGKNMTDFFDGNKNCVFKEKLSTLTYNENILEEIKKIESSVNINMTEKEKILFKLKSIDEKEVDRKSYDLLCENEILGRLDLTFDKKSEILEKNGKKFEKYKVLEEQKEDKFFVDYPYEEVFSLFKDCIDTAEKAYGEIFDTLKQNGWKEIDITNISFSSLRLKTYAKSKLTDEQIQELNKVTQLVFRKFYNENRLLENNLLIYPLNNQVFKFLIEELDSFPKHNEYRKNVISYLNNKYESGSIRTLMVLGEFELNNRLLPFEEIKFKGITKKEHGDKFAEFIFSESSKDIVVSDEYFEILNINKLIQTGFENHNIHIIKNILNVAAKCDINYLLGIDKNIDGFDIKEKYNKSFLEMKNKISNEKLITIVNGVNECISMENSQRKKRNEYNKSNNNVNNNIIYTMIDPISSWDDIFDIYYNNILSVNGDASSKLEYILSESTVDYSISRVEKVINNPLITNVVKSIFIVDKEISKEEEDFNLEIKDLINLHYRKETFSPYTKLKWIESFGDKILKDIKSNEEINNIEKIFVLGNHESCLVSKEELKNLVDLYNEYKKEGGEKYLLAHMVLSKNIYVNMAVMAIGDNFKEIETDLLISLGELLFFNNIDINEILLATNKIIKNNQDYKGKEQSKLLLYMMIGSISEKNYYTDGVDSDLDNLGDLIKRILFNNEKALEIENLIKEKREEKLNYLAKQGISLFVYNSISNKKTNEYQVYEKYLEEKSNEPIMSSIQELMKPIPYRIDEIYLKGFEDLFMKKMQTNQSEDLALLAHMLEVYKKREGNYSLYSFINTIERETGLKNIGSDKNYDKLSQIFNRLSKNALIEEIKSFGRMQKLYEKINKEEKPAVRRKGKI